MSSSTDRARLAGRRARRSEGTTEAGKDGRPRLPAAIFGLDATDPTDGAAPILLREALRGPGFAAPGLSSAWPAEPVASGLASLVLQGVGDAEEEDEWDEDEEDEEDEEDDEDWDEEDDDEDWDEEDEEDEEEDEEEE